MCVIYNNVFYGGIQILFKEKSFIKNAFKIRIFQINYFCDSVLFAMGYYWKVYFSLLSNVLCVWGGFGAFFIS